jgi:hypothetical protein
MVNKRTSGLLGAWVVALALVALASGAGAAVYSVGEGGSVVEGEGEEPFEPCPADSVYSQPPQGPDDDWSMLFCDDATAMPVAEYFKTDAGAIAELYWWGFTLPLEKGGALCEGDLASFEIQFYDDASSQPGTSIHTETVFTERTDTGLRYGIRVLYRFHAVLDAPVNLNSGWVSLLGNSRLGCIFLWLSSATGDGHCLQQTPDTWEDRNVDVSLCLIPGAVESEGEGEGEPMEGEPVEGETEGEIEGECNPDVVPPEITGCPADFELFSGANEILPDMTDEVVVSDNCGNVEITQIPEPGTRIYENTLVTLTVTDSSGLMDNCVVDVTLIQCDRGIYSLIGLTYDEAFSLILSSGDNLGDVYGSLDGIVVAQEPEPGYLGPCYQISVNLWFENEGGEEGEGEGEVELCGCCNVTNKEYAPREWIDRTLGEWLLVGLSLLILAAFIYRKK